LCDIVGGAAQTKLVCQSAPQRAQTLELANTIANLIDNSLKAGGPLFKNPANRATYTNIVNNVMTALKDGFAAPNICDAIANSISDPLGQIPIAGPYIVMAVKFPVKTGCDAYKTSLGC